MCSATRWATRIPSPAVVASGRQTDTALFAEHPSVTNSGVAVRTSVRSALPGHLLAALFAGAMIGYERSYNGRPAGFRTHALVCMSSSLLMLVTVYEATWVRSAPGEIRLDPTRHGSRPSTRRSVAGLPVPAPT